MTTDIGPPLTGEELKRRIVEFAHGASTEITTQDNDSLPALSKELLPGTAVYVAQTPKATLEQVVHTALQVQALGLRASPHIVARRLVSEQALRTALRRLHEGGVEQVLLVAGDLAEPLGPFRSTLDVLDGGCLEEEGIQCAGICGHPEGNKNISTTVLWEALRHKQAFAERTRIRMHIVTQFSFDPKAICLWTSELAQRGISLPVHVGIPGPIPLPKLIKFAVQCGVGASLRSVMKNMGAITKAARLATSPDEMLVGLVLCLSDNGPKRLRQPHFFTFGSSIATALWLRKVREGRFELPPDGGRFHMQA